jgi:small-conductance mechanosensitive channel
LRAYTSAFCIKLRQHGSCGSKNLRWLKPTFAFAAAALIILLPVFLTRAQAQSNSAGSAILQYLDRAISWYRGIGTVIQTIPVTSAAPARDDLQQESIGFLQNAFEYARAQAGTLPVAQQAGNEANVAQASRRGLQRAYAAAVQRSLDIQTRIATVSAAIQKASGKKRADLLSQRDVLQSHLKLSDDIRNTLQKLVDFVNSSGEAAGAAGVLGHINDLEQTVPEARPNSDKKVSPGAPANSQTYHEESAGIISLSMEIFTLMRGRVRLDEEANATNDLLAQVNSLRQPVIQRLRQLVRQSQDISNLPETVNADQLTTVRQQMRALQQEFQQVSNVTVPLGKQAFLLESARGSLVQWSAALQRQYMAALRQLVIRFVKIVIIIGLILILSEAWRRLTLRYIRDGRLRRQMLVIRRVVIGFSIVLAVILSLVTEFGSFATFAGFLTAGIAVALQNLILSVVAYFFLVGRYGVRAGDRVTISGVTGEVVEVGLVRLYMMELTASGTGLRPSGRIAVFSNSVLFQPSALFKQLPGTDYSWHTVSLTLAADVDLAAAESRLSDAVNSVYSKYRDSIQRQHSTFEESVNVQVPPPAPERSVKYTDAGLVISVRYPVETGRAAAIDEEIMKTLLEIINREPKIHFAGTPKIQVG